MSPFSPSTSLIIASYKLPEGVTGSVTTPLSLLSSGPWAVAQPCQSCRASRASWECLPFRSHRAPALLCSEQNAPVSSSGSDFCAQHHHRLSTRAQTLAFLGLPGDPKPFEEKASSEVRSGVLVNCLPKMKTKALICSLLISVA